MSAIAGIWRFDGRPDPGDDVARMLRALALYGPDDGAHRATGPIVLGRRLKRLLPEDRYDRQPIETPRGLVVADVRLDNREELIGDLRLDAGWARAAADAAIVAAALERWGEEALQRLAGPFALAWWEPAAGKLRLARSVISNRPLHYHRADGFFAFASMPKGLHALPEVPYEANLDQYSARVAHATAANPGTFFVGIERLLGGRLLTIGERGIAETVFWRPARRMLRLSRPADYEEALRDGLDQAVARALRGVAGDVASELSGGLDSTSVTASAALAQQARGGRVTAYTHAPRLGFAGPVKPDRFPDESGHAAAVAALYPNIEHLVRREPRLGPLDGWDRYIQLFDKPARGPLNVAWAFDILDDVKARGLSVVLCASMGNASISWEGRGVFADLFQAGRWLDWWRTASACVGRGGGSWPHVLKHTLEPVLPLWALRRIPRTAAYEMAGAGRRSAVPADEAARFDTVREGHLPQSRDDLERRIEWILRIDPGAEAKGVLGGWGIDVRDPTADLRLVELCLSIPNEQYFRGGVGRALVRDAMRDRLPAVVTAERRAGLQSADWFERLERSRDRIVEELDALAACAPLAARTDVAKLRAAIENWPSSGWERLETRQLYGATLLQTLQAAYFCRRVMGVNAGPDEE